MAALTDAGYPVSRSRCHRTDARYCSGRARPRSPSRQAAYRLVTSPGAMAAAGEKQPVPPTGI
jgi:hypothetical protein